MFAFVGLVSDLVEVVDHFLLMKLVVRVDACVSEVVCNSVGRACHVGCREELFLLEVWRRVTIRVVPGGCRGGVEAFCWPSSE